MPSRNALQAGGGGDKSRAPREPMVTVRVTVPHHLPQDKVYQQRGATSGPKYKRWCLTLSGRRVNGGGELGGQEPQGKESDPPLPIRVLHPRLRRSQISKPPSQSYLKEEKNDQFLNVLQVPQSKGAGG